MKLSTVLSKSDASKYSMYLSVMRMIIDQSQANPGTNSAVIQVLSDDSVLVPIGIGLYKNYSKSDGDNTRELLKLDGFNLENLQTSDKTWLTISWNND